MCHLPLRKDGTLFFTKWWLQQFQTATACYKRLLHLLLQLLNALILLDDV
jgi:hypothetical protein